MQTELEAYKRAEQQEYRTLAYAQQNAIGAALTTGIGITDSTQPIGTRLSPGNFQQVRQQMSFDPNTDPAYMTTLSTLQGMWQVKWGDRWVPEKEVLAQEDFWKSALARLEDARVMECSVQYSGTWYRLKG